MHSKKSRVALIGKNYTEVSLQKRKNILSKGRDTNTHTDTYGSSIQINMNTQIHKQKYKRVYTNKHTNKL